VLTNLSMERAVAAVFMVGETAVHFPQSRPRMKEVKGKAPAGADDGFEWCLEHQPFAMRQLKPALMMAAVPTMEEIIKTWSISLE
jgi:hypothetical protein